MTDVFKKFQNPDGSYDGIAAMASMTGLSRKSMLEIAAEVKANHAKLQACEQHEFGAPTGLHNRRRICARCGGEADSISAGWYEEGAKHALKFLHDKDDTILRP